MAIIKAFAGALGGTFADLWKDIITAGRFDEYVVVAPGVPRGTNNGRGSNEYGSEGVISNGSHIYVPEITGGADTATFGAGAAAPSHATSMSVAEQVETLKKLKELVDIGILSQEEFDMKKHEVLGL